MSHFSSAVSRANRASTRHAAWLLIAACASAVLATGCAPARARVDEIPSALATRPRPGFIPHSIGRVYRQWVYSYEGPSAWAVLRCRLGDPNRPGDIIAEVRRPAGGKQLLGQKGTGCFAFSVDDTPVAGVLRLKAQCDDAERSGQVPTLVPLTPALVNTYVGRIEPERERVLLCVGYARIGPAPARYTLANTELTLVVTFALTTNPERLPAVRTYRDLEGWSPWDGGVGDPEGPVALGASAGLVASDAPLDPAAVQAEWEARCARLTGDAKTVADARVDALADIVRENPSCVPGLVDYCCAQARAGLARGGFVREAWSVLVVRLSETRQRELLVRLLASMCVERVGMYTPTEFAVVSGGEDAGMTLPALVLFEAYAQAPRGARSEQLAALRRGFAFLDIGERDADAFVRAARAWYEQHGDTYHSNPRYGERYINPRLALGRESVPLLIPGAPSSAPAGKPETPGGAIRSDFSVFDAFRADIEAHRYYDAFLKLDGAMAHAGDTEGASGFEYQLLLGATAGTGESEWLRILKSGRIPLDRKQDLVAEIHADAVP